MRKLLILFVLCLLMGACTTTKYVQVPVETIKTEYIHNTDSIYLHDSIFEKEYIKGDTVFFTKYKYKVLEKYNTDTIVKVDSIPVVVEVDKFIEVNKLHWWQETLIWLGGIYLLLLIIGIVKRL